MTRWTVGSSGTSSVRRFKKTCADNGIGFAQWFEHRGGSACGVILAGQKHRLDAQSLARLNGADDLDKLVATGIPGDNRTCAPNIWANLAV